MQFKPTNGAVHTVTSITITTAVPAVGKSGSRS